MKAKDKENGNEVILKQSFQEKSEFLLKEKQIMQLSEHPNIIKCYGYKPTYFDFENQQSSQMGSCIVLEYCHYGNLSEYLIKNVPRNTTLSIDQVKHIFDQISSACIYLFKTFGIIHRDIKFENFLISEIKPQLTIKLCDLGLSIKAMKQMENGVGSPLYAAPEIMKKQSYDETCDLYSLGIVLYYLTFNKFPFDVTSIKELMDVYNRCLRLNVDKFKNDKEYKDCIDLIQKLIVFDKENRMQWDEFICHPFIKDYVSLF